MDRLPPLLLVVLYNGGARWSAETGLKRLIALPEDSPLWYWQPQARYHLLDMGMVPGDELARKQTLAALLVRLEQRQGPETLLPLIDAVIDWFRTHPDYDGLERIFTDLVADAISQAGLRLAVPGELRETRAMFTQQIKLWREEWTAEGMAKGMAKGEHKAQARTLLRLLDRRFGPVPADVRERVEAAEPETLDLWLDRIVDAPTRDAVFEETDF
jgi:hypothetical protein